MEILRFKANVCFLNVILTMQTVLSTGHNLCLRVLHAKLATPYLFGTIIYFYNRKSIFTEDSLYSEIGCKHVQGSLQLQVQHI